LRWLKVLDESMIGTRSAFFFGHYLTSAAYLGSMIVLHGEAIHGKFGGYPKICTWLGNMKSLKSWPKVNEAFYKYVVDPNKGKEFIQLYPLAASATKADKRGSKDATTPRIVVPTPRRRAASTRTSWACRFPEASTSA